MNRIFIRDRITGKLFEEQVFGKKTLELLYGKSFWSRSIGWVSRNLLARVPLFSRLFGWWYKSSISQNKIKPFIQHYQIDPFEFALPVDSFTDFNAFFIRKLKPESRPIALGNSIAVIPADGRYLFYQNLSQTDGFIVKGQKFDLESLIGDSLIAKNYSRGAMVIARLCPTDYHRFHFPMDCIASLSRLINGFLYSVNPWALACNVKYLTQNKRFITILQNSLAGAILFIEIGATGVGSVIQTYNPSIAQKKGDEKGYFEFGASCLILLFEPGRIVFDQDLLEGPLHQEVRCLMGQSMGKLQPPQ